MERNKDIQIRYVITDTNINKNLALHIIFRQRCQDGYLWRYRYRETIRYGSRNEDKYIYIHIERGKDIDIDVKTDIDTDIRKVIDMDRNVDKNIHMGKDKNTDKYTYLEIVIDINNIEVEPRYGIWNECENQEK